jgi:hypothetical protein
MARVIVSKGAICRPVTQYGVNNSDETAVPQPDGTFPDNTDNIPIFALKGLMFTSVYDTNDDGVVDKVDWAGVQDPPQYFPSTIPMVQGLAQALQNIVAGTGVNATYAEYTVLDATNDILINLSPSAASQGMQILTINGVQQSPTSYHLNTNGTLLTVPVDLVWIGAEIIFAYAY